MTQKSLPGVARANGRRPAGLASFLRWTKEKVSGIFFTDSERIPNLFASQLRLGLAMP
jgi:hypothetical protein